MYKKWLVFVGYALAAAILLANKDALVDWIKESGNHSMYLVFAVATLFAVVPVIPFGVVAGVLGMKYGPVVGGMLNVASSTTAAVILFLLVRIAFRDQARAWLTRFKRIDRFTSLFERNAFMAVLIARLIPILPAPAVNGYAALSRMKFATYFTATLIGKVPVMFVFAWIGDQLFVDFGKTLAVLGIYAAFVVIVYGVYSKYMNSVGFTNRQEERSQ